MRKLISLIATAILFAALVPAANAARGVPYKGKTTGGHKVTFGYAGGKAWDFVTGVPMTSLS